MQNVKTKNALQIWLENILYQLRVIFRFRVNLILQLRDLQCKTENLWMLYKFD